MIPKNQVIEQNGVVECAYPNARFKVKLENGHIVQTHLSGRMKKFYINIIPGDRVKIEISPYDLEKGRIVYRYN